MADCFVDLHTHSQFSCQDGFGNAEQVRDRLQELGHKAMGLTDHGVSTGHAEFFRVFKAADLKLVPGVEFYHCEDMAVRGVKSETNQEEQRSARASLPHLTVLALSQQGYQNLLALHKISYREGFYYRPRIDWNAILRHQEGLVVMTGCVGGHIARLINDDKAELAHQWLSYLKGRIEHLYAEIVPIPGLEISHRHCQVLWTMAGDLKIPRVVTSDAHFPRPEDYAAEDTMAARSIGKRVDDPDRKIKLPAECYRCSGDDIMARLQTVLPKVSRHDLALAVGRSMNIADQCEVEPPRASGPIFNVGVDVTPEGLLWKWIVEGFEYRKSSGDIPATELLPSEYYREFNKAKGAGSGKAAGQGKDTPASICSARDTTYTGFSTNTSEEDSTENLASTTSAETTPASTHGTWSPLREPKTCGEGSMSEVSQGGRQSASKGIHCPAAISSRTPTGGGNAERAETISAENGETPTVNSCASAIGTTNEKSEQESVYLQRAKYEWGILVSNDFVNYVLVVADIMRWARKENILAIARGSCGGSLLCWYLGITQLDPITYDLPVERFIGHHRSDLPDIDIDIDSRYRHRFYEFLIAKYGADNCAQVAALSRYRARQALRDTAAAHDLPEEALAAMLDLVPEAANADEGLKATGTLRRLFGENEKAQAILKLHPAFAIAAELEGQIRASSVHAAGFVVDARPIHETVGIMGKPTDLPIAAVDKDEAARLGLLKIDLLSVDMLSVLARVAEDLGKDVGWLYSLPMDDPASYKMLGEGRNAGIFQLQGTAAGRLMRELQPKEYEDVCAVVALARPGPLQSGGAQTFVARHRNHTEVLATSDGPTYTTHPILWNILSKTHGVVLYQEQVMRIAREAGGYDWATAEKIRKVVSKIEGAKAMEPFLDGYLMGCAESGIPEREALLAWDQCVKAGNYCLSGDTEVYRAFLPKGGAITIRKLYEAQQSDTDWGKKIRGGYLNLFQMDVDGRVRLGKLKAIYYNGQQEVFQIFTNSGRSIAATANHRFLTDHGYKTVSELKVGDRLIVTDWKRIPRKQAQSIQRELLGTHYEGSGWPSGASNPAWIDGRTARYNQNKAIVLERAQKQCEICKAPETDLFEIAHLISLELFEGNYNRYHHHTNLRWLCNSCHKRLDWSKNERKRTWSRGYLTSSDPIVEITSCGVDDVYDVSMNTPMHNFVANGIVSHNSFNAAHGYAYAKVAVWSAYLKTHYPAQFAAAFAQVEDDPELQRRIFNEFREDGGKFVLIDPNLSQEHFVCLDDRTILGGFQDLEGCGPVTARKLVEGQPYADWSAFYRACPKGLRDKLYATGLHEKRVDQDVALLLAPWFVEVSYSDLERQAALNMRALTVHQAVKQGEGEVRLVGRLTQIQSINVVAEAKKYGQRPPGPGEPTHRAVLTLADETGSVPLHVSPQRLEWLVAQRGLLQGPHDGVGNSVYITAKWNWTGTRLYVEDVLTFRPAKAFEPITPRELNPTKDTKAKKKGKADAN